MSLTTQATRRTRPIPRTRSVGGLAVLGGLVLALGACSSGGARPPAAGQDAAVPMADSGASMDAAMSSSDAGETDGGGGDLATVRPDLALPTDLGSPPSDLATRIDLAAPTDLAAAPDLAFPSAQGVAIYVSNTCVMDVLPKSIDVPRGATLKLTFNNRSRDYEVTVWMSYGGGYTDLATGGTWPDPIEHCRLPRPYKEYADVSTACSSFRMWIYCL